MKRIGPDDDCPLRSPSMRGMPESQRRAARLCWLCGDALSPRGHRWCARRATRERPTCAQSYWANHGWSWARFEAVERSSGYPQHPDIHRASYGSCDECGSTSALEVNHVLPRNGEGYGEGCHHHQTNLQVLCHACHVVETTRQVRERKGIPEGGRPSRSTEAMPEPLWSAA